MRKISASRILPVSSSPLTNGIISLDGEGRILDLIDTGGNLREEPGLEFYHGIIIPGFVLPWLRLERPPVSLEHLHRPGGPGKASAPSSQEYDPEESRVGSSNRANDPAGGPATPSGRGNDPEEAIAALEKELILYGIRGVGLVFRESMVSDRGFERMSGSDLFYHPVIELCPGKEENAFEVFHRGIEMVSHAWNRFNLSCSLTACVETPENRDLTRYLKEYKASHRNVDPPEDPGIDPLHFSRGASLDILRSMHVSEPGKTLQELLPRLTLQAAAAIFEDDELGSIEPGKKPGLNLVSVLHAPGTARPGPAGKGYDPETFRADHGTTLKVLV